MDLKKLREVAEAFLEIARGHLEKDGSVMPVCLADVEVNGERGMFIIGGPEMMGHKDALARTLRGMIAMGGVEAVFLISEIWKPIRRLTPEEGEVLFEKYGPPGNWPEEERGEGVLVNAQCPNGVVHAMMDVHRIGDQAVPGEVEIIEIPAERMSNLGGRFANFFMPREEDLGDGGIHNWGNAPVN